MHVGVDAAVADASPGRSAWRTRRPASGGWWRCCAAAPAGNSSAMRGTISWPRGALDQRRRRRRPRPARPSRLAMASAQSPRAARRARAPRRRRRARAARRACRRATSLPPSRIAMRWQRSASSGWWVVTMTLRPRARAPARRSDPRCGAAPRDRRRGPARRAAGASGSCSSTRAISIRRRMPPEYFAAASSARAPSSISAQRLVDARAPRAAAAGRRARRRGAGSRGPVSLRSRLGSWKTTPRRGAVRGRRRRRPARPSRASVPAVGGEQPGEQPEGGGLAGAVRAEQAEELAAARRRS